MQNIKNYNNIFDSKNISTFLKYKIKNYNINLLFRKKLLYKLFYFFFQKEARYSIK